ncbi:MAG TPA: diacylglycerol kinase family protein [Pirellulales bacterium]|nr:diacylglycerol kinase family protein [Pirellulales bacterium]
MLLFANPTAGTGQRHASLEQLSVELIHRGLHPQRIEAFDELTDAATQLQRTGQLRAIVAAGGDGTAAEIANRTPPGTPLAIFPMGTANLLAHYLEIAHNPTQVAQIIADGHYTWLDAGRANGRVFLLMAGVGFDAEVVRRLHATRSGNIRGWTYAKPIWHAIRTYRYPELRVYCARAGTEKAGNVVAGSTTLAGNDNALSSSGSVQWEGPLVCRWAFVFNVSRYAAGLNFAPTASGSDGQLDLCTFQRGGLLSGLKYLFAILRGRHSEIPDCTSRRGVQFRIESDAEVLYELDGDPGGALPLTIDTIPRRLCLLVPARWPSID